MAKMTKVAHLTSVHAHSDTRIFIKECCSLADAGFEVHLVAPGAPDTIIKGVRVHGVNLTRGGRLLRMTSVVRAVYKKAKTINAEIYHFHDPELILAGLMLKAKGSKVIYDMHEDVPRQILDKQWIPKPFRKIISTSFALLQSFSLKFLDGVVLAESLYAERLPKSKKYWTIRNYPISNELGKAEVDWSNKRRAVCYIGGLTEIRGVREMVEAISLTDIELLLGGKIESDSLRQRLESMPGWRNVKYLGQLDRAGVASALENSMAGLVVLHPVQNYMVSEPTKMFEYMSAGIPVIASDFPVWRRVLDENQCGVCVDPMNPEAIAHAIQQLVNNPAKARHMGENGRRAIDKKYSWEKEKSKLLSLYNSLLV